jgi:hypothetical protein
MRVSRRQFVTTSTAGSLFAAAGCAPAPEAQAQGARAAAPGGDVPAPIAALQPFPGAATPVSDDERRARIGRRAGS